MYLTSDSTPHTGAVDGDYEEVSGAMVNFAVGDVTQNHTILINDDGECEEAESREKFTSHLIPESGALLVTVVVPQTTVTIDDLDERECGK